MSEGLPYLCGQQDTAYAALILIFYHYSVFGFELLYFLPARLSGDWEQPAPVPEVLSKLKLSLMASPRVREKQEGLSSQNSF